MTNSPRQPSRLFQPLQFQPNANGVDGKEIMHLSAGFRACRIGSTEENFDHSSLKDRGHSSPNSQLFRELGQSCASCSNGLLTPVSNYITSVRNGLGADFAVLELKPIVTGIRGPLRTVGISEPVSRKRTLRPRIVRCAETSALSAFAIEQPSCSTGRETYAPLRKWAHVLFTLFGSGP